MTTRKQLIDRIKDRFEGDEYYLEIKRRRDWQSMLRRARENPDQKIVDRLVDKWQLIFDAEYKSAEREQRVQRYQHLYEERGYLFTPPGPQDTLEF